MMIVWRVIVMDVRRVAIGEEGWVEVQNLRLTN